MTYIWKDRHNVENNNQNQIKIIWTWEDIKNQISFSITTNYMDSPKGIIKGIGYLCFGIMILEKNKSLERQVAPMRSYIYTLCAGYLGTKINHCFLFERLTI